MGNVALITGASSGIGRELARVHASRGGDLVLVARRRDRLEELRSELTESHGINVLVLREDLTDAESVDRIADQVRDAGLTVEILINNAGFGGHGLFHESAWESDRSMIRLNVEALAALTRRFLPEMVQRGRGRILNVGSSAGFVPGPFQAVYYATKAFVLSFSEAIANELQDTGVTVTVLCPGPVQTEFGARANLDGIRGFERGVATAAEVARAGYDAMQKGRTVAVHGPALRFTMHVLLRFVPRSLVVRLSRRFMEKK